MTEINQIVIDCGDTLSIADVSTLYTEILTLLADGQQITLDVSKITRIDTAAIQLIYAFYNESLLLGYKISWHQPSDVFCQSVSSLGLAEKMNINNN